MAAEKLAWWYHVNRPLTDRKKLFEKKIASKYSNGKTTLVKTHRYMGGLK